MDNDKMTTSSQPVGGTDNSSRRCSRRTPVPKITNPDVLTGIWWNRRVGAMKEAAEGAGKKSVVKTPLKKTSPSFAHASSPAAEVGAAVSQPPRQEEVLVPLLTDGGSHSKPTICTDNTTEEQVTAEEETDSNFQDIGAITVTQEDLADLHVEDANVHSTDLNINSWDEDSQMFTSDHSGGEVSDEDVRGLRSGGSRKRKTPCKEGKELSTLPPKTKFRAKLTSYPPKKIRAKPAPRRKRTPCHISRDSTASGDGQGTSFAASKSTPKVKKLTRQHTDEFLKQRKKAVVGIALEGERNAQRMLPQPARKGPEPFAPRACYVPDFGPRLSRLLATGTKQQVAAEMKNLVSVTVEFIARHKGSGNPEYYDKTIAAMLERYPKLSMNPLLTNAMRKSTHPNLALAAYSEDSDADKDSGLKVEKGAAFRRTHPENSFVVVFKKLLSRRTRQFKSKRKTSILISASIANWKEFQSHRRVIHERYTRGSLAMDLTDESYIWHSKLQDRTQILSELELQCGYRLTWPLRTRNMKLAGSKLDTFLRAYPRLLTKAYLDIEAQEYFGGESDEKQQKLRQYQRNVQLTWRAVHLLNPEKAAELNFLETISDLGDDFVRFTADEGTTGTCVFPYVHLDAETGAVILKYDTFKWVDMDDLGEALGYAVLLLAMFDMPIKHRSQLMLLLECMFFGFQPPAMHNQTSFIAIRLHELIGEDEARIENER